MRLIHTFFYASALGAMASCASIPDQTSTMTANGKVQGYSTASVNIYKGIPYAAPPIGDRRWKAPAPVQNWTGTLDATKPGLPCVQSTVDRAGVYSNPPKAVSEDCLTLNVWSPKNAEGLPVMVWIHGGALQTGAGSEDITDGRKMAKDGVVVVSINYRLGVLGYLAHPDLSVETDDNISGNYGLQDQIAALKWVQDNIGAFGGDESNVTIAGESAGALSVMYLMSSPQARGLYQKAIAQSAYMISMPDLKEEAYGTPSAESVGTWLTGQLGGENIQDLRDMDGIELSTKAATAGFTPWGVVDGKYLPKQMVDIFDAGEQAPVPILTGFNDGEIRSLRVLAPMAPDTAEIYEAAITEKLSDLADEFLAVYPSDDLKESVLAAPRDSLYGWTANRLVRKQSELGQPSYLYYFNHGYPAAQEWDLHAFHASELPYVFDTMENTPPKWPKAEETLAEKKLTKAMKDYWVSFVKFGRPVADDQVEWPAFDASGAYMNFTNTPQVGVNLLPGMYELHEEIICRRRADGTQPWHWNTGISSPTLPPRKADCE